ncbi:MAG: hypothetical protein ACOYOP_11780 [Microthrixaceae bacterium]
MSGPAVILGLARTRRGWLGELARWCSTGRLPAELVTCLSVEEALAVLGAGRRVDLLLVDDSTTRWGRDLVAAASRAGAPTVVVRGTRAAERDRDWEAVGCAAAIGPDPDPGEVAELLRRHAVETAPDQRRVELPTGTEPGHLLAVVGTGGSGASTVAMALAQGIGQRDGADSVVLVDGSRHGSLAAYHDVGDVLPGLPELVELHRSDRPDPHEVRRQSWELPHHGHHLVLGQRRPRDWVLYRPAELAATLDGLRRTFATTVIEVDQDLEGEEETGSVDVEERHALSRLVAVRAELVLAACGPGLHGTHRMVTLVDALRRAGTAPERIVPVVTRAPRSPAAKAGTTRAIAALLGSRVRPPLFVPTRRGLDARLRDGRPLPRPMGATLIRSVASLLDSLPSATRAEDPAPIRPGSLGTGVLTRTTEDGAA